MLRAISRVHTGWQQQSLMYINEHIYVYKITYFIISGTYPGLSVIKLLKIRLYYRPRVANTRRLMLIMVPVWGRSPQEAEAKY